MPFVTKYKKKGPRQQVRCLICGKFSVLDRFMEIHGFDTGTVVGISRGALRWDKRKMTTEEIEEFCQIVEAKLKQIRVQIEGE